METEAQGGEQFAQGHTDVKLQSQDWNQAVWLLESLWLLVLEAALGKGREGSQDPADK